MTSASGIMFLIALLLLSWTVESFHDLAPFLVMDYDADMISGHQWTKIVGPGSRISSKSPGGKSEKICDRIAWRRTIENRVPIPCMSPGFGTNNISEGNSGRAVMFRLDEVGMW